MPRCTWCGLPRHPGPCPVTAVPVRHGKPPVEETIACPCAWRDREEAPA